MHILGDEVKASLRLSVILVPVMGWCSILGAISAPNVERQPPGEKISSPFLGGGVDKSPRFLTVTDSRPLEPSLFFFFFPRV